MKYITILNIGAKTLFTVSIFLVVRQAADYLYVPLINSLGYIVAGTAGLFLSLSSFGIRLVIPRRKEIIEQLKQGWYFFVSTLAIGVYTTSNSFILGLISGHTAVGYYSAAEKLINAAQGLLGPFSQTIYPHLSELAVRSKSAALTFIKKVALGVGAATLALSVFIFVFAPLIVSIILGSQYEASATVLRVMAFLPFIVGLSNVFAIQGLCVFGLQSKVARIGISVAAIHLPVLVVLTHFYSFAGTAAAAVATETFITLLSMKYFFRFASGSAKPAGRDNISQ